MNKTKLLLFGTIVTFVALTGTMLSFAQENPGQPTIRERINADIKTRNINAKNNQEVRNALLENRRTSSTTTERSLRDVAYARIEVMEKQRAKAVTELKQALDNLLQVRGRISERINKVSLNGIDTRVAKDLLGTADLKLDLAKSKIIALASSSPITATSTEARFEPGKTFETGKVHELYSEASQSINEAKESLNKVVIEIARSMGYWINKDGIITATTTRK